MSVFNEPPDSINLIRRKLIKRSAAFVTTGALPQLIHANTKITSERYLTLINRDSGIILWHSHFPVQY